MFNRIRKSAESLNCVSVVYANLRILQRIVNATETTHMSPETLEILRKRAEAHAAACIDLESDPLIQAAFGPSQALKPMKTPVRAGAFLRRQAD